MIWFRTWIVICVLVLLRWSEIRSLLHASQCCSTSHQHASERLLRRSANMIQSTVYRHNIHGISRIRSGETGTPVLLQQSMLGSFKWIEGACRLFNCRSPSLVPKTQSTVIMSGLEHKVSDSDSEQTAVPSSEEAGPSMGAPAPPILQLEIQTTTGCD